MRPVLSIRRKLLLLVLLASLPALGVVLRSGLSAEGEAQDKVEREAQHVTRDLRQRQEQHMASTRQFLATLALLPQVQALDAGACSALFLRLRKENPVYSNIVLIDPEGRVLASALPWPGGVRLSETPHVKGVLATGGFAVGEYFRSLTTGQPVVPCGYPVKGRGGRIVAVLATGVRLDIFEGIVRDLELPEGSTIFMADRNGIRLFNRHFPDPRPDLYPVGQPVTLKVRGLLENVAQGAPHYALGLDGQQRLYVVQESSLLAGGEAYLRMGVSIPVAKLQEQARQSLLTNLALLGLAILLTTAAAWLVARRVFAARIERLAAVAGSYAKGDLSARTELPPPLVGGGPDELGQLGLAVDRIGEELTRQEQEREATLKRLARTQFAVDRAADEIYWTDEGGRLLYANDRAAASLGFSHDELLGLRVFDLDPNASEAGWSELLELLRAAGPVTFETVHRGKSGGLTPKEVTVCLLEDGAGPLIFGSARDISERKRHEALLRSLVDETAAVTGQAFFDALTAQLVSLLGVAAAFAGEYPDSPPTRVRTLSMRAGQEHREHQEYPLAGTPGLDIPESGILHLAKDASRLYPDAPYVAALGAQGYMAVAMLDADGARIGHLSIMSEKPLPTDPQLLATLRLFAQRAAAELLRLRAERSLLASLGEKEVLLKEIHHRVKNNMQIVCSLLSLQARDITDPATQELLAQSRSRIMSMALVHEDLYQTGNLARLDFRHYLKRLAERVRSGIATAAGVRIELDLDELPLSIEQAIPLGLLANELLTNALKHAFPGLGGGVVTVGLRREPGAVTLCVRDDGVGLPEGFTPGEGPSLGMQLAWTLTEQLHGAMRAENLGGACFTLRFPLA